MSQICFVDLAMIGCLWKHIFLLCLRNILSIPLEREKLNVQLSVYLKRPVFSFCATKRTSHMLVLDSYTEKEHTQEYQCVNFGKATKSVDRVLQKRAPCHSYIPKSCILLHKESTEGDQQNFCLFHLLINSATDNKSRTDIQLRRI